MGFNTKNKKYCLILLFLVLSISLLLYCYKTFSESREVAINNDIFVNEIIDNPKEETPSETITRLQKENNNPDIKAILRIPNTEYQTIVPQGSDNKYYLKHLVNKEYSSYGSTFLDSRVNFNSSKILIYGHNSKTKNMPFKVLENYYDENFYKEHKYIEIVTSEGIKKYEIFSVYVETKDWSYYQRIRFDSQDEWLKHINYLKNNSFYNTGVNLTKDDKILILQTCSTMKKYQSYKKKFLLIIAKEVLINEKTN